MIGIGAAVAHNDPDASVTLKGIPSFRERRRIDLAADYSGKLETADVKRALQTPVGKLTTQKT